MATENINIVITSKGTVAVKRDIESIGSSAKKANEGLDMLKGAIAGLITAGAVSTIVRYGDAWINLQNRLGLVTNSTAELNSVTESLFNIAQDTRTSFESVATIYARTAQATERLGYTTEQTLAFTKQLSQAVTLSGSSAEAANAALVQLSQGLASGTLRGEELNSVLEQLPYVAQQLAAGLGVTTGELRKLGEQGKITPQMIVKAFDQMAAAIEGDFSKSLPTVSQGIQVIENALLKLAGTVQSNTGVFGYLGAALVTVGRNFNVVLVAISPLIAALTALAVRIVGGMLVTAFSAGVASMLSLSRTIVSVGVTITTTLIPALISATTAFISFTAALLVNPFTLLVAAIAAVAVAITGLIIGFDELKSVITGVVNDGIKKFEELKKATMGLLDFSGKSPEIGFDTKGLLKTMGAVNKDLDKTLKDGGKTLNEGVKSGAEGGARTYKTALEAANAGTEKAITSGFEKGAAAQTNINDVFVAKFEGTGRNIYDLWNNWGNSFIDQFGTTIGQLLIDYQNAMTSQLEAQAALFRAQAAQIRQEMEFLDSKGYKPGTGPTTGSGNNSNRGGPGTTNTSSISGNGGAIDMSAITGLGRSAAVRFANDNATATSTANNNAVPTQTPASVNTTSANSQAPIVNVVLDPNMMVSAMNSAAGQQVIVQTVANQQEAINSKLGIA